MGEKTGSLNTAKADTWVRVVPLDDLISKALKPGDLRERIFEGASLGLCNLYWRVPWALCAFSGPGNDIGPNDRPIKASAMRQETSACWWKERPEVKFVRIAPHIADQIRAEGHANVSRFPDGLYVPDHVTVESGFLEVTAFSMPVRVSTHTEPAPKAESLGSDQYQWDFVTVGVRALYLDERFLDEAHEYLTEATRTSAACLQSIDTEGAQATIATAEQLLAERPPSLTRMSAEERADDERKPEAPTDPYGLKERCSAVYVLYRTAERCSHNPAFNLSTGAVERKRIAHEAFHELMNEMASAGAGETILHRQLLQVFKSKCRLEEVLHLINPGYEHNRGRDSDQQCAWPTSQGREFLARQNTFRPSFVTDMLALIIGGAKQWLGSEEVRPAGNLTRQEALRQWLINHGLTGVKESSRAFEVITWNGTVSQPFPKHSKR